MGLYESVTCYVLTIQTDMPLHYVLTIKLLSKLEAESAQALTVTQSISIRHSWHLVKVSL